MTGPILAPEPAQHPPPGRKPTAERAGDRAKRRGGKRKPAGGKPPGSPMSRRSLPNPRGRAA
jgi:hypothetical protein